MVNEVLAIGRVAFSVLGKPFKAGARRIRIWFFRLRTRKSPFAEEKARQIVYSVLAGDVLRAISFRNVDSAHIFIAGLRRSSEREFDVRVYVLEQIGEAFRLTWKSELLHSPLATALEVRDIDGDGNGEVIFEDQSYGTGGGSKSLIVYATASSRVFSVTESLDWQNRSGPISPEIEIKAADAPEMIRVLEEVATKHGFLEPATVVDFDSPEFSVQRWHKENGARTSGTVKLHYYQGYPSYKASVPATLDCGPVFWISFFKGPLIGFERLNDRHFVAYSPAWSYNWANCFAFDGRVLWFGSHCKKGLMSFEVSKNVLECYESFQGTPLPQVEKLEVDDGVLILNGTLRVPVRELAGTSSPSARVQLN